MKYLKNLGFSALALLIFVLGIEGLLYLVQIKPSDAGQDPLVGFAPGSKLFVEGVSAQGKPVFKTAPVKLQFFNYQEFQAKKESGTFRVFTLGGSTTYGHPYTDSLSYSRWLREYLPLTQGYTSFEVINAGGISYASYREYQLMREIAQYSPDLIIVYTGHNEFLEERTYKNIKSIHPVLLQLREMLDGTRWWALMEKILLPQSSPASQLAGEVDTRLEHSIGPKDYQRDPEWRKGVIEHFTQTLKRMAALAQKHNFKIIFLTPPANLKDCEPFKSLYTSESEQTPFSPKKQLDSLYTLISNNLQSSAHLLPNSDEWLSLSNAIDSVLNLEKQHAGWWYLSGKRYYLKGQVDSARSHFQRALQEDICPLRALNDFTKAIKSLPTNSSIMIYDWQQELDSINRQLYNQTVLGDELFLDHVHLTGAGHALLASRLVEFMDRHQVLKLGTRWNADSLLQAYKTFTAKLDPKTQGNALHMIAKLYNWAGKFHDAARLGHRGLLLDSTSLEAVSSSLIVGADLHRQGKKAEALQHYARAIKLDSNNFEARQFAALAYLDEGNQKLAAPLVQWILLRDPENAYWQEQGVKLGLKH